MTRGLESDSAESMEAIQASFDGLIRKNPMGEGREDAHRLGFCPRLKLEFRGVKVTGRAGLLVSYAHDEESAQR